MTSEPLDNLVRTRQLKPEAPDQTEFTGLLNFARTRLLDSRLPGLSTAGRFSLAYDAAHGLALAALRWHGYRPDNRYIVFQCLPHTVGMEAGRWRLLDRCHRLRNQAEYEGDFDPPAHLLEELSAIAAELLSLVEAFGPVASD